MATGSKRTAIIIPAYNEAKVIGGVIESVLHEIRSLKVDIIVVDDCSKDDTEKAAKKAGAFVIRHVQNMGAGGATTTGLEYAKRHNYAYAVTMDADGQHSANDCLKIIKTLHQDAYDLIIGSRLIDAKGMPLHRIIGNHGLSYLTYLIFGAFVKDTQSGLKGFSRKALQSIRIKTSGYEFCSEIIWRAKQQRLRVHEIPIQAIYTDYSMRKGQSNWNSINIIRGLAKRKILEAFND